MTRIPVFYRPEMVAKQEHYSPSAGKPEAVIRDWKRRGLAIDIVSFLPASRDTIELAHHPIYTHGVLDCQIDNGFGNRDPAVAATLPYTVGSMIAAAKHAVTLNAADDPAPIACSPTSGFHHAHYSSGFGFCTFNGLVIAALELKRLRLADRVGILDCDFHAGDGTEDIIRELGLDWIEHWSAGSAHAEAEYVAKNLAGLVKRRFRTCDVLLYQAGADQHVNDPLGGLLTTEQMRERDRQVFYAAAHYGIPLAWNLAGGYQRDCNGSIEPVLALHRQTMEVCIDVYNGGAS